jgi:hypothetical protein
MNIWRIIDDWLPLLIGVAFPYLAAWLVPRLFPGLMRRINEELSVIFPALKMEPWLYEPIESYDLPPDQRAFFQEHTPILQMLGCQPLGDFFLRRDAKPSCTRFFLSRDAKTFVGLSCYLKTKSIEGVSVLLDGTYLESSTLSLTRFPPKEHGLRFFSRVTRDARELVDFHVQNVEQVAAEQTSEPAILDPGDLVTVMNYGRRLSLGSLNKEGILRELPEFLREQAERKSPAEADDGYSLAAK